MTRREKAMDNFLQGYNCSQSLVLAFADLYHVDQNTILRLASPFGGGMGRMREVCGSVSGMFMVTGLIYGYQDPKAFQEKKELYEKVQELARRFEEIHGSIVCRELLGLGTGKDLPTPEKRTEHYYNKRPCKEIIGSAAEILEEFIRENPPE